MQSLELALKAGRKRQSPVTGLIHLCYEKPEYQWHAIPVYENFCFALTLLRTRLMDNVLEAKQILTKLCAFYIQGNFPIYLHDYPECRFTKLNQKIYPVLFYILRDFQSVLGSKLVEFLKQFITENSYEISFEAKTPEQWGEQLIYNQLKGLSQQKAFSCWDAEVLCYRYPQKQEKLEPAVTLYDIFLGQWGGQYSPRALNDHFVHLQASLIYPYVDNISFGSVSYNPSYCMWGKGNPTHSLMLETTGNIQEDNDKCTIHLNDAFVENEIEIAYFINIHEKTSIKIYDQKATTFQLKDRLKIDTCYQNFHLFFTLIEGQGTFCGHIYQGNRKGQLSLSENRFAAYDWVIALRTVERKGPVIIQIDLKQESLSKEYHGSSY